MDELELELKKLLISALNLEGVSPADIDSDEPLFGDGLGLDSIDGLELGMVLRKTYGLKLDSVNDEVRQHFASIRNLARFINDQRGSANVAG